MIIELYAASGLCNRLRTIMGFYLSLKHGEIMQVVWKHGRLRGVNGTFLDYFEPLPSVEFTTETLPNPDYIGNGSDFMRHGEITSGLYEDLRLTKTLRAKVKARQQGLGTDYVAVHIRRTDHIEHAKKNAAFTNDSEFVRFLDRHPGKAIYIATDNLETFEKFRVRYPDQVRTDHRHLFDPARNGRRHTDLESSVIDLYMCIGAAQFKGSGYSSFTDFIATNRL